MKTPSSEYIIDILIKLLADQEGVVIKYDLVDKKNVQ